MFKVNVYAAREVPKLHGSHGSVEMPFVPVIGDILTLVGDVTVRISQRGWDDRAKCVVVWVEKA